MPVSVAPTESQVFEAVGNYLTAVLPSGTPLTQGQQNRVPEPQPGDFVVMWDIFGGRLETNTDSYLDAVFTGSVVWTELTITAVNPNFTGKIAVGSTIFGAGVAANTVVTALGTGTGGTGTYTVNNGQTVASRTLAAGTSALLQPVEVVIQVDVHGPSSANNARLISTTFRDEFAVDQLATSGIDIAPLYSEDPLQAPFINAEKQYETKWTVDLHLQVNFIVTVPQQFASAVDIGVVSVDATFPPN